MKKGEGLLGVKGSCGTLKIIKKIWAQASSVSRLEECNGLRGHSFEYLVEVGEFNLGNWNPV